MKAGTSKSTGKISKGAPSGMVISLMVHAGAFFVAGLFVVFTVVNKPEPEFISPPSIERPKMKLKKPKVKVKKSSQPKPSSRIVAKVRTKQMPEIQLPDLMGTGEGLIGGIGLGGDFLDLPDLNQVTLFGSTVSAGNDLVGTFYDFKRKRNGAYNTMSIDECKVIFYEFMKNGWDSVDLLVWGRDANKPLVGRKFGGYLITVTDERGVIIYHEETSKWLWEYVENLKELPVNSYFDERCERVGPTRPTSAVLNV